jgi:hypothetical protein
MTNIGMIAAIDFRRFEPIANPHYTLASWQIVQVQIEQSFNGFAIHGITSVYLFVEFYEHVMDVNEIPTIS